MYIQITTRCNLSCDHCLFDCTEQGEDMAIETFQAACEYDEPSIGGGEPTLHPQFADILRIAMDHTYDGSVGIITNGTQTTWAKLLMHMAKAGIVWARLSEDSYHPWYAVDDEVRRGFTEMSALNNTTDGREPMYVGRAIKTYYDGVDPREVRRELIGCDCNNLLVKPNGDIHHCSCPGARKIGDVWCGIDPDKEERFRSEDGEWLCHTRKNWDEICEQWHRDNDTPEELEEYLAEYGSVLV